MEDKEKPPSGKTIGDLEEEIRRLKAELEEAQGKKIQELTERLDALEAELQAARNWCGTVEGGLDLDEDEDGDEDW
jgi:phage host-nuclease inhibitor protein Gam